MVLIHHHILDSGLIKTRTVKSRNNWNNCCMTTESSLNNLKNQQSIRSNKKRKEKTITGNAKNVFTSICLEKKYKDIAKAFWLHSTILRTIIHKKGIYSTVNLQWPGSQNSSESPLIDIGQKRTQCHISN